MKIQQIRSATVKITYSGRTYLMDPWLQNQGEGFSAPALLPGMQGVRGPIHPLPFSPKEILSGVDAAVVSHIHGDHFTRDYLPLDFPLIMQNEEDAKAVREMGFTNVDCFAGEPIMFGSTKITRVDGVHGSNSETAERMGKVSGFVFEHPGEKTLYIAGDTVYCQAVEETIDRFCPEVIVLNCCAASMPIGRLIMDLPDVQAVCDAAPGAVVIASHMDNVNHALLTRKDIRAYAKEHNLEKRLLVPEDGESVSL